MNVVSESLNEFTTTNPLNFIEFLKSKWEEIHRKPNVFRYKIDNLKERIVAKYLLQLNPDRASNRRMPELITDMNQPFSEEKFNFTKVSKDEFLFSIGSSEDDPELNSFIVNVSPISRYHTLLCPFINKKLPQAVTLESLFLVIQVMFLAKDSNLKIGFNSLCGLASVNHLHFHMFIEENTLPVENMEWKLLIENLYCLAAYPVPAFCYKIPVNYTPDLVQEVFSLIKYLQQKKIAHNLFIRLKPSMDALDVFLFPRKSTVATKQLTDFNVAVCELAGWFPVYSEEAFVNIQWYDLEEEMTKWSYDKFIDLCTDVSKVLY